MTTAQATQQIKALIGRGRIFGATFRRQDGTIRTGAFRLGVRHNLTGAGLSYDPDQAGNLVVFDMNKRGYRTICLDRVVSLRVRGREITV